LYIKYQLKSATDLARKTVVPLEATQRSHASEYGVPQTWARGYAVLKDLRESLVDLEETMQFNLTYSSAHISGRQVSKDEESLRLLREEVARVEQFISEK
jgi:hypothetical protein